MNGARTDIELACADLAAAIDLFAKLGLRVDMIMPADDPRVAELSKGEVRIRLTRTTESAPIDGAWREGRAGMQYRDLIPDRRGGAFIASHIRVPNGGPVPDYVHHHAIRFQMIYCYRGWVRLVYEGQGEPFVMREGDCVLQPPHIRHRVLECSPGLEVIELASPASHATYADHEMTLPGGCDCDFDGQRFVWLRAHDFGGMTAASGGLATARVRRDGGRVEPAGALTFGFVLRGMLGHHVAGDAFVIEQTAELTGGSADLEWLEVTVG